MRVGETLAVEIRHRIGFAPDDVIQNPIAEILQHGTDAEDIVVAANYPQTAIRFQHTLSSFEPVMGELVISFEVTEFVPIIILAADARSFRAMQIAAELKIVRRIG